MSATQEALKAAGELFAEVERLESKRRSSNVVLIIAVLTFLSILYSLNFLPATEHWAASGDLSFWTVLIFGVISVGIGIWRVNIVKRYKAILLPVVLNELNSNWTYDPSRYLDVRHFIEADLFSSPDRYDGSDLTSVAVGETDMVFSFIHAESRDTSREDNGSTRESYSTIFRGLLVTSEFNKRTNNKTVIWPVPFEDAKGDAIKMDDVRFNQLFSVYASDRTEAFYLLTPGFMERLIRIRNRLGKIYVSIHNTQLYMAIDMDSSLGVSLWRPLTDASQVSRIKNNIESILDIPNELNLNTRIWGDTNKTLDH